MRKHLFLAILLILPLHVSCSQDAQPEKQECAYAGWSTPLTLGDSLDYFATPSLVVQDDSVYVAAPLATPPQPGRGYALRSLGGRQTFFSDSPFWSYPTAARIDAQGAIHVVWAAPADTASSVIVNGFPPDATNIYYRRYSDGRWSPRTLVDHNPNGFRWGAYPTPRLLIDKHDHLHLVFRTYGDEEKAGTTHYARKEDQGWTVIDTELKGAYPSLTVEPSGRLLLALVKGKLPENPRSGDQDRNSVLLSLSTDQGVSWSEPALVNRSGLLGAHLPQFVEIPSETIHLLWAKEAEIGGGSRVIWHARSIDATSWSVPEEIGTTPGGLIHNFRAVGTSDTCMHLVFELETSLFNGDPKLYYARWDGQHWTEPQDLFIETYSIRFDLTISEDGSLHLIWMRVPNLRWGSATPENMPGPEDRPSLAYSVNRPSSFSK